MLSNLVKPTYQALKGSVSPKVGSALGVLALTVSSCLGFFVAFSGTHTQATGSLVWQSPTPVDMAIPATLSPSVNSISCPSSSLCVEVTSEGTVGIIQNPGPSPTTQLIRVEGQVPINSIACPTTTLCVAVDNNGDTVVSTNPTSSSAWIVTPVEPAIAFMSVSCSSVSFCVVGDNTGNIFISTNPTGSASSWTKVNVDGTNAINGLSCPTTTMCEAVDNFGNALTYNGTTWSAPVSVATAAITSVSCRSTTVCVLTAPSGSVEIYNGTAWSAPFTLTASYTLRFVSCTLGCVAIDSNGDYYFTLHPLATLAGGASVWFIGTIPGEAGKTLTAASCLPASGSCAVSDYLGNVFFTSGPTGPNYSTPAQVFPYNFATSISCPTSSFCAAALNNGQATTYNGSTWTSPQFVANSSLGSVSCVSSTFCIAVGFGGGAFEYNGSIWENATSSPALPWSNPVDSSGALVSVSCTSTTFCIAVDNLGNFLVYLGGSTWSAPAGSGASSLTEISCIAANNCVAIGTGNTYTFTGSWSGPTSHSPVTQFDSISCTSSSFCVAVDNLGNYVTYNGSTWSSPSPTGDSSGINPVSCVSATFCAAGDQAGHTLVYNGTTWSLSSPIASTVQIYAMGCASSVFCWAGASNGFIVSYNGSGWTLDSQAIYDFVTSISCVTTSFCIAVDQDGNVNTFNGSTWGTSSDIDGIIPITGVSCYSTSACVAVDGRGDYATYSAGTWSAFLATGVGAPLTAVSCVSSTFCEATASNGSIANYSGASWTAISVDPGHSLSAVSCPSSSACMAVDNVGNSFAFSGTWSSAVNLGTTNKITSVSCPSTSFCMAVDNAGNAYHFVSSTWSADPANPISPAPFTGISCTSGVFCTASDLNGAIKVWDGGGWSFGASVFVGIATSAVSCPPSGGLCVVGGIRSEASFSTSPKGTLPLWTTGIDFTSQTRITSLSCPSTSLCFGGDAQGRLVVNTNPSALSSSTSLMTIDSGHSVTAMECVVATTTGTTCFAGDNGGGILFSSNPTGGASSWTRTVVDSPSATIDSIACTSPSQCIAVDNAASDLVFNGTTWSAPTVIDSAHTASPLNAVSCPSSSLCAAVDNFGDVLVSTTMFTGSPTWSIYNVDGGANIYSLSCPGVSLCVAGDMSGKIIESTNPTAGTGAWSALSIDTAQIWSISCATTTQCVAVDGTGKALISTNPAGGVSTWTSQNINFGVQLVSISCPDVTVCVASDILGDEIAGIQPYSPPPPPTVTYSVVVSPNSQTLNPKSTANLNVTVTQTTTNASTGLVTTTPVSAGSVSLDISSGPDQGQTFTQVTNSSGVASFSFTNNGTSGVDTVTAGYLSSTTNQSIISTATVTFVGLDTLTLTPALQGSVVGAPVLVVATALDPTGTAVSGATVTFSVASGPDAGQTLAATTDAKGDATLTLSAPKQGTDSVGATLSGNGVTTQVSSNSVTINWAAPITISTSGPASSTALPTGGSVSLTLELSSPASALIRAGGSLKANLLVAYDLFHALPLVQVADSGIVVNFSVSSGPNSGKSGTATTDASGTATWGYTDTGGPGVDTVSADFTDVAGLSHSASYQVTWAAPTTTTSTTLATTTTTTVPTTLAPTTTVLPSSLGLTSPPLASQTQPSPSPTPQAFSAITSTQVPSSSPPGGTGSSGSTSSTQPGSSSTGQHSNRLSGSKVTSVTVAGSSQAISLPQPVSSISNGNIVTRQDVKALVRAGDPGPAMHYIQGYGLGLGGGPPGPVPLANSIPSPTEAIKTMSVKTAGQNAGIALLLLILVALPATLFNSTLKEHHKTLASSRGFIRRAVDRVEGWLEGLHTGALLVLFSVVGSALYALVDPTFGLNRSSFAEIAGYVGAILITTCTTELARGAYVKRRFHKIGDLRAFPLGVAIALILVLFSRLSHFEPGYVFGVFAAIVFRVEPTKIEDGKSVALASTWLMAVSALSWLIWIPVKGAVISGNHSVGMLILDSLLSTVWVCGLQSLLFGLIPMKYLDGDTVWHWSKSTWIVLYLIVMFVFVQFVMHPSAAGFGGNQHASMFSMLYLFLGFTVVAAGFWGYFRLKHGKTKEDEGEFEGLAQASHSD